MPFSARRAGAQRSANRLRQIRRPAEPIDAGPQRLEALLEVRAGERDAVLELLLRRAPHRVRRQRADSLQRRQRRVALARRRMHRQHFPHEQRERIARRRRQRAVKLLQSIDERFNAHGHGAVTTPHSNIAARSASVSRTDGPRLYRSAAHQQERDRAQHRAQCFLDHASKKSASRFCARALTL